MHGAHVPVIDFQFAKAHIARSKCRDAQHVGVPVSVSTVGWTRAQRQVDGAWCPLEWDALEERGIRQ